MSKIKWVKAYPDEEDSEYISSDKRFELEPLFLGRTTIQGWNIRDTKTGKSKKSTFGGLKRAKELAEEMFSEAENTSMEKTAGYIEKNGRTFTYYLTDVDKRAPGGIFLNVAEVGYDGKYWYFAYEGGNRNSYTDEHKFRYTLSQEMMNMQKASKIVDAVRNEYLKSQGLMAKVAGNDRKAYRDDWVVAPEHIIRKALILNLITPQEAASHNVRDAARAEAESLKDSWPEGEGFGSSDMNASVRSMLNDAGFPADFVHGRLTRTGSMDIKSELVKVAKELVGMDFPTQKAMDKYLRTHPDADRSNHKVVKTERKGEPAMDKESEMEWRKKNPVEWEKAQKALKKEQKKEETAPRGKGGLIEPVYNEFKSLEKMDKKTKEDHVDKMIESKGIDQVKRHFNNLRKHLQESGAGMEDAAVIQEALNHIENRGDEQKSKKGGTKMAAIKKWDSKFLTPREAKLLGSAYSDVSYRSYQELDSRDQEMARNMFPHKAGDYGAKYPFIDEHYYYPTTFDGKLYRGGRRVQRVLAIPYRLIKDEKYMAELGYEVSPSWHGASELVKIAKELMADKKDISRAELTRMLGGRKFTLRKVSFSDLARGEAVRLKVEGVPGGDVMSRATYEANKEILDTLKDIKENYTLQGLHILLG